MESELIWPVYNNMVKTWMNFVGIVLVVYEVTTFWRAWHFFDICVWIVAEAAWHERPGGRDMRRAPPAHHAATVTLALSLLLRLVHAGVYKHLFRYKSDRGNVRRTRVFKPGISKRRYRFRTEGIVCFGIQLSDFEINFEAWYPAPALMG